MKFSRNQQRTKLREGCNCTMPVLQTVPRKQCSGSIRLVGVSFENAVIMMAAIAKEMRIPLSELQVLSIRRIID